MKPSPPKDPKAGPLVRSPRTPPSPAHQPSPPGAGPVQPPSYADTFSIMLAEEGQEPRRLEFDKAEIVLGRIQSNDIVLPKETVSQRHCRISYQNKKCIIVDLNSTNGTFVNGQRLTAPYELKSSDVVCIADFVIKLGPPPLPPKRKKVSAEHPSTAHLHRNTMPIDISALPPEAPAAPGLPGTLGNRSAQRTFELTVLTTLDRLSKRIEVLEERVTQLEHKRR
jgi:pSer/pThr/pTyr-binding forkhead associated (FHA) protein